MNSEHYKQLYLARYSSHPACRRQWLVAASIVALAPLTVLATVVLVQVTDFRSWIRMLTSVVGYAQWLATAGAFGIGVFMTIILTRRLSEKQLARVKQQGVSGRLDISAGVGVDPWIIFVGVCIAPLLPLVLSNWAAVPTEIRFVLRVFSFVPVVAILIWFIGPPVNSDADGKRRPIWRLLLTIVLGLAAITVVHDIATTVDDSFVGQRLRRIIPFYNKVWAAFFLLVLFVPLLRVSISLWRLWMRAMQRQAEEEPAGGDENARKHSLLSRVGEWLTWLVSTGEGAEEPEQPTAVVPPPWLAEVLRALPAGVQCKDGPVAVGGRTDKAAAQSGRQDLALFFCGHVPTTDQVTVLARFVSSFERVVVHGGAGLDLRDAEPGADLLIDGVLGSGRTTAAMACGLYAAFVRGQRVLFIVPDETRGELIRQRVDAFLDKAGLRHYVACEILDGNTLPRILSGSLALPHVIIATPEHAETHLYGHDETGEGFDHLRRLIQQIEVVIIDDFMDFDDIERSNLPFLIDKQRLIMAAEQLPLQAVVTCEPLAPRGREHLSDRLFSQYRKEPANLIRIRPPSSGRAWRVDVTAEDAAAGTEGLVRSCLAADLNVVHFRRGLDEMSRAGIEAKLRERVDGGKLTVIGNLDEPLEDPGEIDAVFYDIAVRDFSPALRLSLGHDDTVIFAVAGVDEPIAGHHDGIIPVVADRSATPLLVSHLLSITRFLRPRTPVPAAVWRQVGLARARDIREGHPQSVSRYVRLDHDHWKETRGSPWGVWAYFTLPDSRLAPRPVALRSVPENGLVILRSGDESVVILGRSTGGDTTSRHRIGRWITDEGIPLREIDLAHARRLRLVAGRKAFTPADVRHTRNSVVEIRTEHWLGGGDDAYLPVLSAAWTSAGMDELRMEYLDGSPGHGLRWVDLIQPDVAVAARLEGLLTEHGFVTDLSPIAFAYPAHVSAILLQPTEIEIDALERRIATTLTGPWATRDSPAFAPALTGALGLALESRLSGISWFVRFLAFTLDNRADAAARAVLFLLEPASSGRTAMPVVRKLLRDREERRRLFEAAARFLDVLQRAPEPRRRRFLRTHAQIGWEDDASMRDMTDASNLVRHVLDCFDDDDRPGRKRPAGQTG